MFFVELIKPIFLSYSLLTFTVATCQTASSSFHQNVQSEALLMGPAGVIDIVEPSDVGMNSVAIQQLMNDIANGKWINIHGLIIIKNDHLVAEGYWNGSDASRLHDIRSASKSVASILTGIAIQNGFISGADALLYDFLPEYQPGFPDTILGQQQQQWISELTIAHLLNMTSGFEYDDWYENFRGENEIQKSRNWLRKAATSKLLRQPGTFYAYNTASLVLLSEVIARASGMRMKRFAEEMLFEPLQIDRWKWYSRRGVVYMGGVLRVTLRDMAKICLLMLNNGVWNDQQLLSAQWIHESTALLDENEPSWQRHGFHHHYLWWQLNEQINGSPIRAFYASGNGGQTIMFIPEHEMVIAITTGNYNTNLEPQSVQMIRKVILPAISGQNNSSD